MTVWAVLLVVTSGIIIADAVLLIKYPTSTEGVIIFIMGGVCLACVPYAISLSVRNTARYKCAFPYSSYANGTLILHEDSLEYVFWRVGPREPAAYSSKRAVYKDDDKFVYRIQKNDIVFLAFEGDICRIKGKGAIRIPEWTKEDDFVRSDNYGFSFAMAFEQKNIENIIIEWRDKNG